MQLTYQLKCFCDMSCHFNIVKCEICTFNIKIVEKLECVYVRIHTLILDPETL